MFFMVQLVMNDMSLNFIRGNPFLTLWGIDNINAISLCIMLFNNNLIETNIPLPTQVIAPPKYIFFCNASEILY